MTQRLIDANNLIQKLRGNVLVDVTTELEKEIENAPTIDHVKHGKWNAVPNKILIGGRVATQGTAWECSACNNSSKQYFPTMKHCPNCGARMDGE